MSWSALLLLLPVSPAPQSPSAGAGPPHSSSASVSPIAQHIHWLPFPQLPSTKGREQGRGGRKRRVVTKETEGGEGRGGEGRGGEERGGRVVLVLSM